MNIDPGVITLIQTTFLEHINTAFATTAQYALRLLYLFAVIELIVFGLVWALQHDFGWERFFFKVLKIGLIFFIIQNYAWLFDVILKSFAQLAGIVINSADTANFIFNPAKIWQYGYDAGLHLLQIAAVGGNFGLILIQICLGAGILLVFGFLGVQIALQIIGFYLTAFGALIMLPFGTFQPSGNMFDKSVQAVLQAGIRVMTLIMVIGIAVTVWNGFGLVDFATANTDVNINQPLGLFFTALLFLYLAIQLPPMLADVVGAVASNLFAQSAPTVSVAVAPATAPLITPSAVAAVQAATTITTTGSAASLGGGTAAGVTVNAPSAGSVPSGSLVGSAFAGFSDSSDLSRASSVEKSISEHTLKQIRDVVQKASK